ncbi:hypothetical protein MAM1_0296d09369 [Mucor ambiguus]|uniref:Nibrin second BRCT domain-containing protein n=1 Tax=Mucor ambiguus TaxID=91626 RepID=A0A0C9MGK3_9FUNG|nr:hypothetical protein MAM1_0296d09369 [Mucor ambiguus]
MWFLNRIVGNARTQVKTFARLKPDGSYLVNPRGSQDKGNAVRFRVLGFSKSDVVGSRSRPDVILQRNGLSVVVDGHVVTEDEQYLHDQQILHIGEDNMAFKISWEPVSIYHDKRLNPDVHQKLIEQGEHLGFYVINGIRTNYDKPTHYCISVDPDLYQLSPFACLALASNNVYFIRPDWVEELGKAADQLFDFEAFNDKIQPITVDKYEEFEQTAIFGPDERRKRLFKRMDFWFFDQQQFNHYAKLIKLVGGKADLKTCEQVLMSDIDGNPLFVAPPNADILPDWHVVHEKYCKEMDVIRVLLDKEIMYAIAFCSTNVMCNPASAPTDYMNPDSAAYASFESASLHPISVKLESLDATMPVTCPQDDMNYRRHHEDQHDDDDYMQVKPEPVESTPCNSVRLELAEHEEEHVHCRRTIKEEVYDEDQETEATHQESTSHQPQYQEEEECDLPDTVRVSMPLSHHSSPAFAADSPAAVEEVVSANNSSPPPMSLSPSVSQSIEPINAIPASMDLDMDVDAFLGGAFENLQTQKKKDKEKKIQDKREADKRRQEEEKLAQENRHEDEERHKLLQEQIAKERAEYEARLQERIDYNAGRGGSGSGSGDGSHVNQNVVMQDQDERDSHDPDEEPPLEEDEDYDGPEVPEQEQRPSTAAPTESHQEEAPLDYYHDPTVIDVVEPNPDQGQFSRIIYRNLEVNPRPPSLANGIVNYKKFKKVKQFENYSSFEQSQVLAAPTVSSSQNHNRRRARGIQKTTIKFGRTTVFIRLL